jgi:hypothetical protein
VTICGSLAPSQAVIVPSVTRIFVCHQDFANQLSPPPYISIMDAVSMVVGPVLLSGLGVAGMTFESSLLIGVLGYMFVAKFTKDSLPSLTKSQR